MVYVRYLKAEKEKGKKQVGEKAEGGRWGADEEVVEEE